MSNEYMEDDLELDLDASLEGDDAESDNEFESSIFDELDEVDFAALGIDPTMPTEAKPGSERKVMTLAARYAAGLPLWHGHDRYDHGPGAKGNFPLTFDA